MYDHGTSTSRTDRQTDRQTDDLRQRYRAMHVVRLVVKSSITSITVMNMMLFHRCVHCKNLLPVFEKAAQELKKSPKGAIPLAKVDAKAETSVASKYEIKRYPTVKVFRRGKVSNYKSGAQDKRGL